MQFCDTAEYNSALRDESPSFNHAEKRPFTESLLDNPQCSIHIHPMDKDQVAEVLVNIATLLDLKGENPFKSRAYLNAARALESLDEPLDKVIAQERLDKVEGIGESIRKK